jgi:CubicO group peptidase (beta-lactamase class C family)
MGSPGDAPPDAPEAPDTGDTGDTGEEPWEAVPAFGPLVAIDVAWTDDDGRPHRTSLESMLLDVRTGEPLPERDWVYVGGRFGPLRQGRRVLQVHVADLNGNVVAIYLDGQGLCLFERNSLDGVDDTLYTIHPENAPRRGTPATIVFTATGEVVQPPPPRRDDVLEGELAVALDASLEEASARGFSGVVQVERGGRPLLRKAYGTLDAGGAPLPADAVFPTGALGRRLIATAVLDAVATGALSLDDLLARHVDDVPPDKAGVRIRHLLEDSSGMPASVPGAETIDRARALDALLRAPLVAEPGEHCVPSAAGYALLLIALENAAEDVWRGLLGERVLAPAHMADTGLWGEPRWDGSRLLRGTTIRDGERTDVGTPAERLPTWQEQGAGAIIASVRDLARFERALAHAALPEAATTFVPACEPPDGAWRIEQGPAGECLVVAGMRAGFHCELRRWSDADLVLILGSNGGANEALPGLVALLEQAAASSAQDSAQR